MKLSTWQPGKRSNGRGAQPKAEELLLSFDCGRQSRIMICPALFDEANKLRRFTLGVMRELDVRGIDSAILDLPGTNESLALLEEQTLAAWREDARDAAAQFGATHILSIRAGALYAPPELPGWRYAALDGAKQLSAMLRAQVLSQREAGKALTREKLLEEGRKNGAMLSGWSLSATMLAELETARAHTPSQHRMIEHSEIGGAGLWLRAEPGESGAQSATLASMIAHSLEDAGEAQT